MITYPNTAEIAKIVYGGWIDDRANIYPLEQRMQHTRFCDYSDAHKCGWIAIVMFREKPGSPQKIGFRFNPRTVTLAAMISAEVFIKNHMDADYMMETSFAESFPVPEGHERKNTFSAREVKKYFSRLRFWKQEMVNNYHPGREEYPSIYPKSKQPI